MPCIPAIQINSVTEVVKQDVQDKLNSFQTEDLDNIVGLDDIKYPLLFIIVTLISTFQGYRGIIYYVILMNSIYLDVEKGVQVLYPIIALISALRAGWLLGTSYIWDGFWTILSDTRGWNWDDAWSKTI